VDKFRNYKSALFFAHMGTTLSLWAIGALHNNSENYLPILIMSAVYGFFALTTYPVALEMAAELTFPVPEQFSAALLVVSACVWTVLVAYLVAFLNEEFSHAIGVFTLAGIMTATTAATLIIKPDYKRMAYEASLKEGK